MSSFLHSLKAFLRELYFCYEGMFYNEFGHVLRHLSQWVSLVVELLILWLSIIIDLVACYRRRIDHVENELKSNLLLFVVTDLAISRFLLAALNIPYFSKDVLVIIWVRMD